jgi:hypothetical protein
MPVCIQQHDHFTIIKNNAISTFFPIASNNLGSEDSPYCYFLLVFIKRLDCGLITLPQHHETQRLQQPGNNIAVVFHKHAHTFICIKKEIHRLPYWFFMILFSLYDSLINEKYRTAPDLSFQKFRLVQATTLLTLFKIFTYKKILKHLD